MAPRKKRILVHHLAGQFPMGGIGWQAIHYVVGLERLGYEVYYVEDSGAPPYDPRIKSIVEDCAYNVSFVKGIMERFGLRDRWAYWDLAHNVCYGLPYERLMKLYGEADALVNVCGTTRLREEHLRCPIRIYLETDPVYEQIKLAQGNALTREFLDAHTHHFTYGENLGKPGCPIPLPVYDWKTTRPPVVLDLWKPRDPPAGEAFTTVATWQNVTKDITFEGVTYYWSKHLNFLTIQDLPLKTPQRFELALETTDPDLLQRLRAKGWSIADPYEKSKNIDVYQEYIYASRGEFTVSKDLVVRTRSGWFSDRSVCYLAAGKPVITQETGFSTYIPTGAGLFSFDSLEEVLAAVERVNADYPGQCRAARQIACEYFSSDTLLAKIMSEAGV